MKTDLEYIGNIVLHLGYWDCDCENNYIHPIEQNECVVCEALEDEQPNSRTDEVFAMSLKNFPDTNKENEK